MYRYGTGYRNKYSASYADIFQTNKRAVKEIFLGLVFHISVNIEDNRTVRNIERLLDKRFSLNHNNDSTTMVIA
jgi:hypothetical protein